MESEESPSAWRKPADIMRLRRKRKSSTVSLRSPSVNSPESSPATQSPGDGISPWRRPGQKRRNPFGCSPRKRMHYNSGDSTGRTGSDSDSLLGILSGSENIDKPQSGNQKRVQDIDSILANREKEKTEQAKVEEPAVPVVLGEARCPVDWSVKTRARFISPRPFSWCTPLKTLDEAAGLAAFTRASPDTLTTSIQDPARCEHAKREVQKHTLYYQHPNLPWLRLFPRMVPDNKIGKAGSPLINDEAQAALMSDWSNSFISAFNQLRGGQCPYLYLSAHAFTVLFRAGGIGGRSQLHALLTPTSRGLRESLNKEGIEFTMPLAGNFSHQGDRSDVTNGQVTPSQNADDKKTESTAPVIPKDEDEEDEDDDITATDDGASSFLETLGLDSARFRSLDPKKIKIQRESYRLIDHRPESLVLVEGGDTQALFNFLLNCRSCVASAGIQAGIPPTLLAPVPFKGATLKALKLKTSSVRQRPTAEGAALWHSVELEGVLLPHSVDGLTRLFTHTQGGQYTATFTSHDPTAPLNATPPVTSEPDVTSEREDVMSQQEDVKSECEAVTSALAQTGIQPSHVESVIKPSRLGKMVIRDIICQDGLYTWNV